MKEKHTMAKENFDMIDADRNDSDESTFEVVDDNPFFAPVTADLLDPILAQYKAQRVNINRLADVVMGGDLGNVVHYFIEGNAGDDQLHRTMYVDKLFNVEGAVGALNSAFWSKALALTDVYELMPQARKNEWNAQLRNPLGKPKHYTHFDKERAKEHGTELSKWEVEPLPDFEDGTVRDTIAHLLHARSQFLGERVDGIFRALSGHHVTNAPEGFGKRMIVANVLTSYGTTDHERVGYLHDLRCVIAKFMGREEPKHHGTTDSLIRIARAQRGEWVTCDGGALKLKVFKVGTAHLEVHPDLAYRLNQILAFLHPTAIPAQFRTKPRRKPKAVDLLRRPLPFAVTEAIARMRPGREKVGDEWRGGSREVPNTRQFDHGENDKNTIAEATRIIESIGGVKTGHYFAFEYEPREVLNEIAASGCVPDNVAHQFYPTPASTASEAANLAEIGEEHRVLEPSAGNGDLAAYLPKAHTLCIEVSPLRCSVLTARGFNTMQADFLAYAESTSERFDRIVANPPFSDGRWKAHTEAAAGLVAPGGRLVFVLPASARNAFTLPGFDCTWSRVFANEFADTGVSVAILVAQRT